MKHKFTRKWYKKFKYNKKPNLKRLTKEGNPIRIKKIHSLNKNNLRFTSQKRGLENFNDKMSGNTVKLNKITTSDEIYLLEIIKNKDKQVALSKIEKMVTYVSMSAETQTEFLRFIKSAILRTPLPPKNPQGPEFHPEDDASILCPDWKTVGTALIILKKFVDRLEFTANIFEKAWSSLDVLRLLEQMNSEDKRERIVSRRILEQIYENVNAYQQTIKTGIFNELANFLHNQRSHTGTEELVTLTNYILISDGFTLSPTWQIYVECILPLLKTGILETHFTESLDLFKTFNLVSKDYLLTTLTYFSNVFFDLSSSSKNFALTVMAAIIELKKESLENEFITIEGAVCRLINISLSTHHYQLIDNISSFLSNEAVYLILKKHTHTFVPKIFDELYGLSKKYWKEIDRSKVYDMINICFTLNKEVFERCVKKYNFRKYREKMGMKSESEDMFIECMGSSGFKVGRNETKLRRKSVLPFDEEAMRELKRFKE